MMPDKGRTLIQIARGAIGERFGHSPIAIPSESWLLEPKASFVTLKRNGELKGCIGGIEPKNPLGRDVAEKAVAAAFNDFRFSPLREEELISTSVEISVLSGLTPIPFRTEEEALSKLVPGTDGIVLHFSYRQATFLPQVWESVADPKDFLGHLKLKMGLPANFWSSDFRLERYTVEKFAEESHGK